MQLHHSDDIGFSVTFYEFFYDSFMTISFSFLWRYTRVCECNTTNAQNRNMKYGMHIVALHNHKAI